MEKQKELELLQKYAEIRQAYEQTNTLSILMDAIWEADPSSSYYPDEVRRLIAKILPDAKRLKILLKEIEGRLLPQMTELQFTLHLPLEKSAMCDLILSVYSREDVPDLATAIRLARL